MNWLVARLICLCTKCIPTPSYVYSSAFGRHIECSRCERCSKVIPHMDRCPRCAGALRKEPRDCGFSKGFAVTCAVCQIDLFIWYEYMTPKWHFFDAMRGLSRAVKWGAASAYFEKRLYAHVRTFHAGRLHD